MALHCTISVLQIVTLDKARISKEYETGHSAQHQLLHEIIAFNEEEDHSKFSYSEASLVSLTKYANKLTLKYRIFS